MDEGPNDMVCEPEHREMKAEDVLEVLRILEEAGIDVCLDGGWGVDALLGEQTRLHEDMDIAIPHREVPKLREVLASHGFEEVRIEYGRDCNFVLADGQGREVDVHSYAFDADGNNVSGKEYPAESSANSNPHIKAARENVFGMEYPVESLTGSGSIDGHPVKCISAEWMVKFHTGYPLDRNDFNDVLALHQRFGVEIPSDYDQWLNG